MHDGGTTFLILLDTGCSISCSGFLDNFHGDIVKDNFGSISMANGQAKIEGFGMLRWEIVIDWGKPHEFLVPGYYSPVIVMWTVSPQDCC